MAPVVSLPLSPRVNSDGFLYTSAILKPFIGEGDAPESPAGRVLDTLWLGGLLHEVDEGYLLEVDDLASLEPWERSHLGIPGDASSACVHVSTYLNPRNPAFELNAELRVEEEARTFGVSRSGPIVDWGEDRICLPPHLMRALDFCEAVLPEEADERWLLIGQLKRLALAGALSFDDFLAGQKVHVPESMGVLVEGSADRIRLLPTPNGVDGNWPRLESDAASRQTYTVRDGTVRNRLVLDETSRAQSDGVRGIELEGPDVPRFLDNPEAFLPDDIDVSQFSPRVRGLVPQRYRSQPYLQVEKSGSREWFSVSPKIEFLSAAVFADESENQLTPFEPDAGTEALPGGPHDLTPEKYTELCRAAVESGEEYQQHGDDWIHIDPQDAERFLKGLSHLEPDGEGGLRIPRERVGLMLDVISNVHELEYDEEWGPTEAFLENLEAFAVPEILDATLPAHQVTGYRWLRSLFHEGLGALLADDMGLGKTVQAISLFAHLKETKGIRPSLVVAPKSLLDNWEEEIRRFCPGIQRIHQHGGPGRTKDAGFLSQQDVVLTTYETLRRDQLDLGQVAWKVLVCDEAQKVKNPTAQVTASVKGLKAAHRVALSGTPVENGLSELWCIVDFVQPGRLGSQREFRDHLERPILDATPESTERSEASQQLLERLVPHYLRRTKDELKPPLPPKEDIVQEVPLGPRQEQLYANTIGLLTDGGMIPIAALTRLIQICSHPELIEPTEGPLDQLVSECPKLKKTIDLLERIRERGERVIVFTRFKRMQRILQMVLDEYFDVYAPILNGEVDGGQRLPIVKKFNTEDGFGAMVLSPEAAGVGLNIVGANHVIHYSRLWNPAKENQATDRVHRMGQSRPVSVHYPIVVGGDFHSVEQHLDELLRSKMALARDVLVPRDALDVAGDLQKRVLEEHGG
jgi:hypothetical protein